jgi:type IV pilus modification protein PilV
MFKINSTKGSTLIEVLVAILIVGLVVTGVMLSITYSVKNSAEARYREVASQLAQDGMEVVKLRREVDEWSEFQDYAPGTYCLATSVAALSTAPPCTDNVTNASKRFTRSVVMSKVAATPSTPQIVTATVTVTWQSDSNVNMNVQITQQFRERII